MEKTHYERMLDEERFRVRDLLNLLREDLPDNPTLEQYSESKFISSTMSGTLSMGSSTDVTTMYHLLYHLYCYHYGAGRTYEVKEGIAEMLLNTKLDVDVSLVKSPFSEIVILVPPGLLNVYNEKTGMHSVSEMYIHLDEMSDINKLIRIMVIGRPNQKSTGVFDDAIFFFKIPLTAGTIMESLKRGMEQWQKDPLNSIFSSVNDTELVPRVFQFTLNVLMYITSADCDISLLKAQAYEDMVLRLMGLKSTAKIRKLQKRIDRESRISRYIVGNSIKLSPEEISLYQEMRSSGKHMIRYGVGGHWRAQWVGKKDAQIQRPTWVRPHFRGPEMADLIKSVGVIK